MHAKPFRRAFTASLLTLSLISGSTPIGAIEIPLESLTPVRIGFVDLQKVFDAYPEKAFAEGDLLKEIQKRKRELNRRQNEINVYRQQISADQSALDQIKAGKPIVVPPNMIAQLAAAEPVPPVPTPTPSSPDNTQVNKSSATEAYPSDDPLLGLPGHELTKEPEAKSALPGMQNAPAQAQKPTTPPTTNSTPLLDQLAAAGAPVQLNPEALAALQKRLDENRKALDRKTFEFKDFRGKALEDMKTLQSQKTSDVMSKIYAILQSLARDESITVVFDKSYVLYGEDSVDLTEKLMSRLQSDQPLL